MKAFLDICDWYLWDTPLEDEPCQIPLYIDLEIPDLPYDTTEEEVDPSRVIIIDI